MSIHNATIDLPESEELLALLLEESGIDTPAEDALTRVDRGQQLRASFAQARLWFIDQIEPGRSTYNIPWVFRLSGRLDLEALQRSLNELVRRHESLRTTFAAEEEQVTLVISSTGSIDLERIELGSLPEPEREAEALRLAAEETRRPFDLACGPLFRACLLRLTAEDSILVSTIHHIISDGWSMDVLTRELSVLYQAYSRGEGSPLEEPTFQYADYAAWHREWLSNGESERQLAYWKRQLQGAPPELALPVDHQHSQTESFPGATQLFELPPSVVAELNALSLSENATLFMTLLAAFKVLLYRYSRQEDISVGTIAAGRIRPELENVIGLFVNTLVMRSNMSGNPRFVELLARIRELTLETLAHQDLPFDKLVEETHPERNLNSTPLFQAMFILQNTHGQRLELASLEATAITIPTVSAMFALTLEMTETDSGLKANLTYRTDLFESATIARLVTHFKTLIGSIVENPHLPISALAMLSERERRQLLTEFNDTAGAYPRGLCLPELFEQQVAATPEAVALVFGAQEVSYAELNERANQLAHYLRRLGVGPEVLVGLCLARGVEMVVALLAILKAGGAYVPLDPAYPRERISFMLRDAGVSLLLTQAGVPRESETSEARAVYLDAEAAAIAAESTANLTKRAVAENLAYVIYTSGSTGQPKGVQITHGSAQAFITWSLANCERAYLDCVLASTSICFDLSIYELFAPLSCGGAVVLADNALQLPQLAPSIEVTLVNTVPSAITELLRTGSVKSSVRRVNLAGEPLPRSVVRQLYELGQVEEVWNLYGPSEDTTYSTAALQPRAEEGPVTIGRPISNTEVYLLDDALEPVPLGVAGELYLGGAGLSRGYLNRPELTATRFIPHPFSERRGARLYRTGDLARFRGDGQIEFLGRVDHQVKLRGYRIELGEIEAVLRGHEQVSEAVVQVRGGATGKQQLVAYLVPRASAELTSRQLREYLRDKLPAYMIPGGYVLLAEMPLTANGKVDRRVLAALSPGFESEGYVAARTPEEEMLVEIWREVLGVAQVGIHDNFFELGGHSLLATRLVARIRAVFGKELTLRHIFEGPSVGRQAAQLRTQAGAGSPQLLARGESGRERLPLSFAQQRLLLLEQLEPGSAAYNIPLAFRLQGPLDEAALNRGLNEIVRRHEALRTVFVLEEGTPGQKILAELKLKLAVRDLSLLSGAELEAAVSRELRVEGLESFDLWKGPLLRGRLLRVGKEEHVLLLTLHHIVSDGWSLNVLNKELSVLYEAYREGRESPLAELPVQYGDYAQWQREWLSGAELERQLRYWQAELRGAPQLLELPLDHARPAVQSYRGSEQHFVLDAPLTKALKQLSRQSGATLYMTLLTGFAILLSRYSRQAEVVLGTPIANRTRAEVEGLIGFFVNTLVLRLRLGGEPTFREALQQAREVCLAAYSHQDIPFEKLVEALEPERSLSYNPLFQAMLVMQPPEQESLQLAGLAVSNLVSELETAKFDLGLTLEEQHGELTAVLNYNRDLFASATVARMVRHYEQLLRAAVAAPDQGVGTLAMLPERERRQLLFEFNDTESVYPRELCLPELFERQVAATPEAVALVFGAQEVRYAELNERANQLAHYLRRLGVGPEVLVGLCLARGVEMVVALLAILKAGGAYVPLDPAYPRERISFMLRDAGVTLLLTQAGVLRESETSEARAVYLEAEAAAIAAESTANLTKRAVAENLAYVIYTSGSTGQPKGVQITHQSLINFLISMRRQPGMEDCDRFLSIATPSFDIAGLELYLPLLVGGSAVMMNGKVAADGVALARHLEHTDVSLLQATPAMWRILIEAGWQGRPDLKLFCGGEPLTSELAQELLCRCKELWNVYGPTETTVWCSALEIFDTEHSIRIGGPIANIQMYVLDKYLEPTPIGVVGELHIGGDGLGRGYWNRPSLTAEKFIPNPLDKVPGSRLYRTGDLVRYLADGTLEYLGRVDNQVKLRGFRIELGEVEATLGQHPAVSQKVVVVREDVPGDRRLVAYVAPRDAATITGSELRSYLKERLPEYMVPSVFAILPALPLTPNGKVDRKALPVPRRVGAEVESQSVAPRTETEKKLARMWSDLIGVESVGVRDSFFELGGHSLLATQLIFSVRKTFRVEVPLFELFKEPTIASLARIIETSLSRVKTLNDAPCSGTLLSPAQQRLWFLEKLQPGTSAHNECIAVRLTGELNIPALQRSIDEVVSRHDILRATFASNDGQPVQAVAPTRSLDIQLHDLTLTPAALRQTEAQRLLAEKANRPFDLSRGPLMRAVLVRLEERTHVLGLVAHQIVCDAASLGLFVWELTELHDAFRTGRPSPLPELSMQYADFARHQREWVKAHGLESQLAYWKEQLADSQAVPELITDKPRSALRTFNGARLVLNLPSHLRHPLTILGERENATLSVAILAAFKVLLHCHTGSEVVVVGTEVAGRNEVESKSLIGPFVNQLVLCTNASGNPTFREFLGRVRDTVEAAHAHQEAPFEEVVKALNPVRDRARTPLFQLKFITQEPVVRDREMHELRVSPFEIESGSTRFDLTLLVEETASRVKVILEYNTDLFAASRIAAMASCLELVLQQVITEPEARLHELRRMIEDNERRQQGKRQTELKLTVTRKLRTLKRRTTIAAKSL